MTPSTIDLEYEFPTKGTVSLGGINISWDFSDMKREIHQREPLIELIDGRIIIPSCGIYY